MSLKQTKETKFLDYDFIITPDKTNVKTKYHNKNHDIQQTNKQTIGRFHNAHSPSPQNTKLSAFSTILIKMYDNTTDIADLYQPTLALYHEAITLQYTLNNFLSILTKANNARKHKYWQLIHTTIKQTAKNIHNAHIITNPSKLHKHTFNFN